MKEPIVEIKDVWLSFRGRPVLEAVDLRLDEGDYLGVIGPNGSGKTTLLRVILGLLSPDRGSVRVLGESPAGGARADRLRPSVHPFRCQLPGERSRCGPHGTDRFGGGSFASLVNETETSP